VIRIAALVLGIALSIPLRALAAPQPDAFLAAFFLTDPIPADANATAVLRIEIVRLNGDTGPAEGTTFTVTRDPASAAVCAFAGGAAADVVSTGAYADVAVTATTTPGLCRVTVTSAGAANAEATLTTKTGGTATRLTVSGNDSPQPIGAAVTLSVDIDDVYVNLVGGDESTVVAVALDPASCSGAPGGPAAVAAVNGGLVTDGRAWFSMRSGGAYGACRVSFTAPGLRPAVAAVTIAPGPPDHFVCAFSPSSIGASEMAALSIELRDIAGNRVANAVPYSVLLVAPDGAHTTVLNDGERVMRMGAAFFHVRGELAGTDAYVVATAPDSLNSLRVPQVTCEVMVRSVP
jgi:hypothetical protein